MKWQFDPEQVEQARKRGEDQAARVAGASYDPDHHTVEVRYRDGSGFYVPVRLIQGLEDATPEQLARLVLSPLKDGLSWEDLDVDVSIEGLKQGVFGTASHMAELGRRGGRSVSEAKAQAARNNGKLGGRPRIRAS